MLQVNHKYNNEQTGIESHYPQLRGQAAMPIKESEHATGGQLHPQKSPGNGSLTIAAAAMKLKIAERRNKVFCRQAVVASLAMRRRIQDGLPPRQTVNAHIEEAAHCQSQQEKARGIENIHSCSLWLLDEWVVNAFMVNPVV
jgi:hypothetical protein